MQTYFYVSKTNSASQELKLEQLKRLRSEDTPPAAPWLPILLTSSYRIPSQNKVKAEKLEKFAENLNLRILFINLARDTPANGSDYLWQIWK